MCPGSRPWRYVLALSLCVLATYLPSLGHEFVNWDDARFVTGNQAIQSWSAHNVQVWWGEPVAGKWRPTTWASLALDRALWDLNPFGFRLQAIALHLAAALLVMALGWHIGLARAPALLAALLWALHPLGVEPVCWITARNYLIAQVFSLAAVLLASGNRPHSRPLALLATILALSAHELAVVTPLLIALDGWRQRKNPIAYAWPYLAAALMFGLVHLQMVRDTGVLQPERRDLEGYAGPIQVLAAAMTAWIWPVRLAPFYGPADVGSAAQLVGGGVFLLLAGGCVGLAAKRGRLRESLFALGWAAIAVLPTVGLFAVASQRADRWLYLPGVGLALALGLVVWDRQPLVHRICVVVGICLAAICLVQSGAWKSSEHLWRRAVTVSPSHTAHHNLAGALAGAELPDLPGAVTQYELAAAAAALPEERALSLTGAGRALLLQGRAADAVAPLSTAVELDPLLMQAHLFLSLACTRTDQAGEALRQARLATALAPDQPSVRLQAVQCAQAAGVSADELAGHVESYQAATARALAHRETFR